MTTPELHRSSKEEVSSRFRTVTPITKMKLADRLTDMKKDYRPQSLVMPYGGWVKLYRDVQAEKHGLKCKGAIVLLVFFSKI